MLRQNHTIDHPFFGSVLLAMPAERVIFLVMIVSALVSSLRSFITDIVSYDQPITNEKNEWRKIIETHLSFYPKEKPCSRCNLKKIPCTETVPKRKNKARKIGHIYPDPAFIAGNNFFNPFSFFGNNFNHFNPNTHNSPSFDYDWNADPMGLSSMLNGGDSPSISTPSGSSPMPNLSNPPDPPSFSTFNPKLKKEIKENMTKM